MISGHDAYSYLMATGFVVAMGAYFGEGLVSRTTGRPEIHRAVRSQRPGCLPVH